MNIIFGDTAERIADSYTVLELDTFKLVSTGQTFTAWCVIESIPLEDFPLLDRYKNLHKNLLHSYRSQQWGVCHQLIEELLGKWGRELDSFYLDLDQRVRCFESGSLSTDWNGVVLRNDI